MIRHTLMWKFKDNYKDMDKTQIMAHVQEILYALKPQIPEIKSMKIELDILQSERSFDMIFLTEFESLDTLEIYRVHPEHVKVAEFIGAVRVAQSVTDTQI